jgi:hypothetical protein
MSRTRFALFRLQFCEGAKRCVIPTLQPAGGEGEQHIA